VLHGDVFSHISSYLIPSEILKESAPRSIGFQTITAKAFISGHVNLKALFARFLICTFDRDSQSGFAGNEF
jgi:hypothetical protein